MIEFSDIKGKYIGNKNLINNVLGSFLVRGFGFLVSFALFPLYLNYFDGYGNGCFAHAQQ